MQGEPQEKKIELLSAKFYYPVPIFDVKKILAQVPTWKKLIHNLELEIKKKSCPRELLTPLPLQKIMAPPLVDAFCLKLVCTVIHFHERQLQWSLSSFVFVLEKDLKCHMENQ